MPPAEQKCIRRESRSRWVLLVKRTRSAAQAGSSSARERPGRTSSPASRSALPNSERTVFQRPRLMPWRGGQHLAQLAAQQVQPGWDARRRQAEHARRP